ncbi:MAG: c-type cytochrome domain-containing protein [Flavobacteriales bacterium]
MKSLAPISFILVLLASAFFSGCDVCEECENPIIDTIYDTIYVNPPLPDTITYNGHIAAITNNYCITCHGGTVPSAGFALETFNQVKDATQNGNVITRINDADGPMPPSGLISAADRALIQEWANDGYLED